ncbi:MAG: amylo-alpha-1,6-glucosidase [Candidatus Korobacteraceae bacterium]
MPIEPVRRIISNPEEQEPSYIREWLVTNGLGGYASGTISGIVTRRYHGLLISALAPPLGRTMMLSSLAEQVKFPDRQRWNLCGDDHGFPTANMEEFRYELGLPVWRYRAGDQLLEKRIYMLHQQNTVYITYRLLQGEPVALRLSPALHFRGHDEPVGKMANGPYMFTAISERYEVCLQKSDYPPLRMKLYGKEAAFTIYPRMLTEVIYRTEESRGYDYKGDLWSPGHFWVDLDHDQTATFVASTEGWETLLALRPGTAMEAEAGRRRRLIRHSRPSTHSGLAAELVLAADQFIIRPVGRVEDSARAHAAGDEIRSVIAGYHWFTDWGRDTMISLEGLTLTTGRYQEAAWILRMFAQYIRDGLIPNFIPEGGKEGVYHTADATLWFFHALSRYIHYTEDTKTLERMLPLMADILDHHFRGTRFGIHVDPRDSLLIQGEQGYQLTWMDAKVGDWVVTPRRGKAVEINALWYNALCLQANWLQQYGKTQDAQHLFEQAQCVRESFNRKFWYEQGGYLWDVIEGEGGNDSACRPNQLLAISLPNPVLDRSHWEPVVHTCRDQLLTRVGLRSLSPNHPDYKKRYFGDLRSRDAAYHQGTVWAWLIGPYIDAWVKLHPEDVSASRRLLQGFADHVDEACIGTISEVFDAEEPHTPRGCCAQAWSVAEVLRCWSLYQTEPDSGPFETVSP